jgi:23S rRNA (guanine745-N1)-methyltransferase
MVTDKVLQALRCPVCGAILRSGPGALRCEAGHAFDIARQGYVNLLTGRPPAGAETPDMVAARAELLAAGHLAPVARAAVDAVSQPDSDGLVLDVGAGTGYYLAAVLDARPTHHGLALDVSKAAARWAARAHPRASSVVADAWRGLRSRTAVSTSCFNLFAPATGPSSIACCGRTEGYWW